MVLTVAGKTKEYEKALTIKELIELENIENPMYVTVSVNDAFIRSEDFDTTKLENGDEVEFLYFMGGGC
ncbi:MAG: sulfur carrier protein ThiS [Eubacterium sp.]|jgi:sulfur carrier protein|nr:sulfur carrier protein ThiS [Eubacterium sp.]